MRSSSGLVARTAVAVTAIAMATLAVTACGRIGFDGTAGGPPPGDANDANGSSGLCGSNPAYLHRSGSPHAYRAVDGNADWAAARASCEADGAYLAIIDDAAEAALLPGEGWVGYTDAATEGVWLTVRGDQAAFLPWQSGEPNGGTLENCARVDDKALESRSCTDLRGWTCECD